MQKMALVLDAVRTGDLSGIQAYARTHSVDVRIRDYTPLTLAAFEGRVRVVRLLLELGAAPNFPTSKGWTPIIAAANDGRLPVVKLLLTAGADPNLTDSAGRAALHHLCFCPRRARVEVARVLLLGSANPRLKAGDGLTPYEYARSSPRGAFEDPELVQVLLPPGRKRRSKA
jgi:ankyrin repeat protein